MVTNPVSALVFSFETYSTQLLVWIRATTRLMQQRNFPNSLEEIQIHFKKFKASKVMLKSVRCDAKKEFELEATTTPLPLQSYSRSGY
jgi:hypothetical protein